MIHFQNRNKSFFLLRNIRVEIKQMAIMNIERYSLKSKLESGSYSLFCFLFRTNRAITKI